MLAVYSKDRDTAILLRAELLKQAEGLKLQREAILSQVSYLEKQFQIESKKGNGYDKRSGATEETAAGNQAQSGTNSPKGS